MALSPLGLPVRQILRGNLLLIACCGFYLAWWLLAFRPSDPIRGMRSGWLLLPAFGLGAAAAYVLARGMFAAGRSASLFPDGWVLRGGIAAYLVLLAVTLLVFHRPVTTELFLIVGWAMLALSEVNALYGAGALSRSAGIGFCLLVAAAAAASLVCYVRYYHLDARAGFVDGMIPLLAAAAVMGALSAAVLL